NNAEFRPNAEFGIRNAELEPQTPPAFNAEAFAASDSSIPHSAFRIPQWHTALQIYDSYLVLETPDGMLVIDQHALHERILFEQLKRRVRSGSLEVQRLLVPEPVELPAEQATRALDNREALAELGLQIEDFGGGTLLLTSYPAMLGNRAPQSILRAMVEHLVSKDRAPE